MAKRKGQGQSETGLVQRSTQTALQPWEAQAAQEARDERSKETLGVPRITHKGGVFRYDDRTVGTSLKLGVLGYKQEKTFYIAKYDPNKPPTTPDCYAFGDEEKSMVAHEASRSKQNLQPDGTSPCNGCKHNVFGTAEVGRGKRCKDYRRLLVISPVLGPDGKPKLDPNAVQQAEVRLIQVPPASLQNFGNYYQSLKPVEEGGLGLTRTGNIREMMVQLDLYPLDKGGHGIKFTPAGTVSGEAFQALMARRRGVESMLTQPYPNIEAEEAAPGPKAPARTAKTNKKLG